uniref:Ig-like domain-containing protein n=1 Tax=Bos indicus x Bos taurus TaxID=30522 RepID=A0A4W2HPQ3_BOBOX
MLFLQLPLLLALLVGGDNEQNKNSEPISFKVICVLSFHNSSWVQSLGSGWLGELQTHGWKSNSGTFIYLWPWSKGNFSNEELKELQNYLHTNFVRFVQAFYSHARKWQFEYRFEVQIAKGCELHAGEAPVGFMRVAYQGSDFLSFQNKSWVRLFNFDTCPRFLLGLLDARKAYLQRPAWLSLGPSPGPGQLTLVCHISGFYPKPIWVMWMRGEQEQQGTQRNDVLPNSDGTSYLRVSLDVEAIEAPGLSCRVRHSSLGGQDIILYWDHRSSVGWIALAVIVTLVLMAGLAFWLWKHWTHRESPSSVLPLE